MNKKIHVLLVCCLAFSSGLFAQRLSPTVIATDGGVDKSGNLSLEWTLGEFAVESFSASAERLYTQGFHQPTLLVKSIPAKKDALRTISGYNIQVYPNPVPSILNIKIDSDLNSKAKLILMDLHGRSLFTRSAVYKHESMKINMSVLPGGLYVLHIRNAEGSLINTFKIVKIK